MHEFLKACDSVVDEANTKNLATLMNMPPVSLLQRANANYDGAWFNVKHLYALMLHTKDMRPLSALAGEFGFDLVARERPAAKPLMAALGLLSAECGDVGRLIFDAAADNHISQHEKAQGEKAILEAIDALQVLRESLKAA
ncbi:phage regulatory CII family protein [Pseudomonas fluorescens]|uniref:phage regulatory CII family protein n=1 Tax=Pseudomonas fluorescens TaxID=294 RepID=UPI003D1D8E58